MKIITDKEKCTIDYFREVSSNITKSSALNTIMFYTYKYKQLKDKIIHNIDFRTVFPNKLFIYIAMYMILIGFVFKVLFDIIFPIIVFTILAVILMIPVVMQTKLVLFWIIRLALRKRAYGGKIICL